MELTAAFETLGIALGLGLLVGMQRERVDAPLAGVRTFGLITLLGALCGMLALTWGGWIVCTGLIGVAAMCAVGNLVVARGAETDAGITTEIATLVMFIVGAYLAIGHRPAAVAVGGGVAVLLYAKPIMRGFVKRLGDADFRAMMQFVLITLVILPVLPDEPYGPFKVLNPRQIWWMVVLIVGISFGGYIALKVWGGGAGAIVGGILGGLISSTATTVSFARRAAHSPQRVAAAVLVIIIASTIVYARVLIEVAIVGRAVFARISPPIFVLLTVSTLLCVAVWWKHRHIKAEMPKQENPTELKSAIIFAAMYAAVLFMAAAAKEYLGDRGIFLVAGISGLTDMDAITLSVSRMADTQALETSTAWRAIVIATIANLLFKAGIVGALGSRALFRIIALLLAINAAVALGLLLLWP